ncbi:sensor histidine kinase [Apibacter sp. HY039]|uniref:sensor histidine kinase n=1 Tax=Apibacter sp. HY039 TaxID=2501476 RepID=UPI000FEB6D63|nr:histidine kinase [Apibacter sp. HY039]
MNSTKYFYNKYLIILLHIGVWGLLFISPYLFISGQTSLSNITEHSWIPLLFYIIIFYLNYLLLINKFIFTKRIFLFILINIIVIGLFVWIKHEYILKMFVDNRPKFSHPIRPSRSFFIYIDSLSMIIPIAFVVALKIGERWLKTEAEKKEIENIKLHSELEHLKYQIQPHFFFNSLNNIYSLVDIAPEKAKETLHSLSKLMRYLLYESNSDKVQLNKEIDFMNKYIELMKLRLTDKTHVHSFLPKVDNSITVPPLLFISIIENAFKHGVSATQESEIDFQMEVNKNVIRFVSKNINFPKTNSDKSGSGIGMENLNKRLDLLYPNEYIYTSKIIQDQYIVILEFKLN